MSKAIISIESVKNALIEMDVMELSQLLRDNDFSYYSNSIIEFNKLLLKAVSELQSEMPKAAFSEIHLNMFMAVGVLISEARIPVRKTNWFNLSNEVKNEIASEIHSAAKKWYEDFFKNEKIDKIRTESELIDEIMKYVEIYSKMRKEAGIKLKEKLRYSNSDEVQVLFNELRNYSVYYLLDDALDALYEELPACEYKSILEEKISWLSDGFLAQCRTRHGLASDRELFCAVKRVIDEWNPERLLPHAPDDEYDIESAYIAEMLQSTESNDINSVAQGVYNIFAKQFSYTSRNKGKPIFPTYIFVAGKLLKAIRDNGLEDMCQIKEFPFSLQELEDIETTVEKLKNEITIDLSSLARICNLKIEDYDNFSAKTYNELQGKYHKLSEGDLDNLHKYCMYNTKSELWWNHNGAFRLLDKITGDFLKY